MNDLFKKFGIPSRVNRDVSKWIDRYGDGFIGLIIYQSTGMTFKELIKSHEFLKKKVKELEAERDDNNLFG